MKEMGLRIVLKRKFVITTDSNHKYLITEKDIDELLTWYTHNANLQRFEFLLEELEVEETLLKQIMQHLKKVKYFPIL
jgi:hypothetical protein